AKEIAAQLDAVGIHVETASGAADAAAVLAHHEIDVCIINPGISADDQEVYQSVTAAAPDVPVVVVTDESAPDTVRRLAAAGAYACLGKPLDARELVRAISRLHGDRSR